MAAEIQVTPDFQTAPVFDGTLKPGLSPLFTNPGAVDVYLDDDPNLLNASPYGTAPISGFRLPAGTLIPVTIFQSGVGMAGRKIYARAAARTTIMVM